MYWNQNTASKQRTRFHNASFSIFQFKLPHYLIVHTHPQPTEPALKKPLKPTRKKTQQNQKTSKTTTTLTLLPLNPNHKSNLPINRIIRNLPARRSIGRSKSHLRINIQRRIRAARRPDGRGERNVIDRLVVAVDGALEGGWGRALGGFYSCQLRGSDKKEEEGIRRKRKW